MSSWLPRYADGGTPGLHLRPLGIVLSVSYIDDVTIRGLAGREGERTYKFDRNINIFWGANGSGKTSLLRIIHAALNDNTSGLDRVPFEYARINVRSDSSDRLLVRTIDMSSSTDESGDFEVEMNDEGEPVLVGTKILRWDSRIFSAKRGTQPATRIRHSYLPISRVAETRTTRSRISQLATGRREAMDDAYFDAMFAEQVRLRWLAYSAEANATIRDVQQQGLAEVVSLLFGGAAGVRRQAAPALATDSEAYALVVQFLRRQSIRLRINEADFKDRYRQEGDLGPIVGRIREILEDIDAALAPQWRLAELLRSLYSGGKQINFTGSGIEIALNDENIPLESLSSGEKQMLQILLEVLAAGAAPVIIDEPELSMHVDWQQRLVADMMLLNPTCQLVLATHSPEIGADLSDQNVHEI